MAALADIEITRGDIKTILLTLNESGTPTVPVGLTTFTAIKCQVRDMPGEYGNLFITKDLTDGISILGTYHNELLIELTGTDTELFNEGQYFIDIRFWIGAALYTYLTGKLIVTYNITAS